MRRDRTVEIRSDVFDIADRIREVDERYRLYYNLDKSRFEVRLRGDEENICVTWTGSLDARLVTKLRETHVRRREALMREIEESEERAAKEAEAATRERIGERSEALMRAAWKTR